MDDINRLVQQNLRQLREEQHLSLDAVARLSGVSKSMLGQIERGEVNPTISTVWKIANGLKVPFSTLMERRQEDLEVVDKNAAPPLVEAHGAWRCYPLFGYDGDRRFEFCTVEMDVGCWYGAEPQPPLAQEYLTVFSSTLTLEAGGKRTAIPTGSAVRFKADRPHAYQNTGDEVCRFHMAIHYPGR